MYTTRTSTGFGQHITICIPIKNGLIEVFQGFCADVTVENPNLKSIYIKSIHLISKNRVLLPVHPPELGKIKDFKSRILEIINNKPSIARADKVYIKRLFYIICMPLKFQKDPPIITEVFLKCISFCLGLNEDSSALGTRHLLVVHSSV